MGGLIVATALTVLFLPALYAAWFRVRREDEGGEPGERDEAFPRHDEAAAAAGS
jgi:hypothetical protein